MNKSNSTYRTKVWRLGWHGMKKETITLNNFPKEFLKIDDWFSPKVGELGLVLTTGKIGIVKSIKLRPASQAFKAVNMYSFIGRKGSVSESLVLKVNVRKGKTFKFRNKFFTYQPVTNED